MSNDRRSALLSGAAPAEANQGPYSKAAAGADLRKLLLAALRGRWKWAIGLGVALGALSSALGWHFGKQMYLSRVELQLSPQVDDGMADQDNAPAANFDSFADLQVQFIKSDRVIDKAMSSEAWRGLHQGFGDAAVKDFSNRVLVTRKSEVIDVDFRDKDANAAMIGVRALVDAYQQIDSDAEAQRAGATKDFLK